MVFAGRNRRTGQWTALLAAYAFALNALLAATLLAATAPAKSLNGYELCLNAASAADPDIAADKATKRAASQCQICLQHAAPVALAAVAASLPEPIPVTAPPTQSADQPAGAALPTDLRPPPRGPPSAA